MSSDENEPLSSDAPPGPRSLRQRLVSGALWSSLGRLVSVGAYFLAHVVVGSKLPKEDYGVYVLVSTSIPFLAMLSTLGLTPVMMRLIRRQLPGPRGSRGASEAVFKSLFLTVCGSVLCTAGFFLLMALFGEQSEWSGFRDYRIPVAAWFVLSALGFMLASALQGLDDFLSAALVGARNGGVIANGLFLAAVAYLAGVDRIDLQSVFNLQVVFHVVALGVGIFIVCRNLYSRGGRTVNSSVEANRAGEENQVGLGWYLRESWPNLLNQLIALSLTELDVFWINYFASTTELADYGAAKKIVTVVRAPLLMLNVVLAPFVAELSSSQQTKRLERVLRGAATLVGLPSLVALLVMLLIPGLVIDWTYGESFRGAALPLSILAFGQFVFVASGANAMTLTMTGHQRVLMASSMLTLTIYCLVAPWAISQGGIVGGAAVGSILLATQNILVTILVKSRIGIWTTVSTSPAAVKDAWRGIVRSRRRANR